MLQKMRSVWNIWPASPAFRPWLHYCAHHSIVIFVQVVIHNIRLPKQSTVGDVINVLKTKVRFPLFWFPYVSMYVAFVDHSWSLVVFFEEEPNDSVISVICTRHYLNFFFPMILFLWKNVITLAWYICSNLAVRIRCCNKFIKDCSLFSVVPYVVYVVYERFYSKGINSWKFISCLLKINLSPLFCFCVLWLDVWCMFYLKQVELSQPNAELRLLEVFYHKIYKVNFFYMGYAFTWSEVYTDYVHVGFPYRLHTYYIRISFSI